MLIFKISRRTPATWDNYISAIVVADSEESARRMHPAGDQVWSEKCNRWVYRDSAGNIHDDDGDEEVYGDDSWVAPTDVRVDWVGVANVPGDRILCTSFRAG